MENIDSEEAIERFLQEFHHGEVYSGHKFFEWHHYLTGSCLQGRKTFVRNHNIDLDKQLTVEEFIKLCENEYGSEIIKQLKKEWESLPERSIYNVQV